MKRLLSISTDRNLFVEGSAVRERMKKLAQEWDEVHVVVAADPSFKETVIGDRIWVYPTKTRIKALYSFDATRLGSFIVKGRHITHITCQDPFLTGMTGISLQRQFALPLELQLHTDIGAQHYADTLGNRIRKSLALSYLPKATTIRVVSERIKRYLVDDLKIAESKVTVRPIAVDTTVIKNTPVTVDLHRKYPQFDKIVLMASRITPEKNIGMAVRAWQSVLTKAPKTGLVIVGNGVLKEPLRGLVQKIGLTHSVVFENWADLPTLYSYYKTADVFLVTSMFEGYGMTLVEASTVGCPIVSTDVGVAPEVGAHIVDWTPADIARGITAALGV